MRKHGYSRLHQPLTILGANAMGSINLQASQLKELIKEIAEEKANLKDIKTSTILILNLYKKYRSIQMIAEKTRINSDRLTEIVSQGKATEDEENRLIDASIKAIIPKKALSDASATVLSDYACASH